MGPEDENKFDNFTIHDITYKTVSNHPIKVAIIIPKEIGPGPHPLAIKIHGGYLVSAHRTFAPFFPRWLLDLARTHSGIILSPDYRLLPSAGGLVDINEDLDDFWAWYERAGENGFRAALAEALPGHEADASKVMLAGGSAGGYGAVQLALSHPDGVNVLATTYPMLDFKSDFWVHGPKPGRPAPMHTPEDQIMSSAELQGWIDDFVRSEKVVTDERGFDGFAIGAAAAWRGMFWKLFDPKGEVGAAQLPVERIREGARLPKKIWVAHGDADTAVPLDDSMVFTQVVREKLPNIEVNFDIAKGKDHGFDDAWEKPEDWFTARMSWLADAWLKA